MISVILGTYNRLAKLKESIISIKHASNKLSSPAEIIVIDGGSTDGTLEYLTKIKDVKIIQEGGLHGVTRAYNRGFRLAKHKYITWSSDDFIYLNNTLQIAVDRLNRENDKTLIGFSIDINDGKGYINYGANTPIGAGHKNLFELVDYWSEDFITYGSDNDFCMKIKMAGGKVIPESNAKVIHKIDINDELHKENLKANKDSNRYRGLYSKGILNNWKNVYVEIWINASSKEELFNKIYKVREDIGWCNINIANDFGLTKILNPMNVKTSSFNGNENYAVIV